MNTHKNILINKQTNKNKLHEQTQDYDPPIIINGRLILLQMTAVDSLHVKTQTVCNIDLAVL